MLCWLWLKCSLKKGAFLFGEFYPSLENIFLAGYKGPVKLSDTLGMSDGLFILLVILAATAMFWIAEKAEIRFARPDISKDL